ncbi:hypothetical protein BT93_G1426 [Corymbia citriodora subsp. variegata]|nr:hypothetical protein BT93_G1426 [Corymbia citriodora subsp. variegata]
MESLFDKLSSFSWDVKAVLTLSAFSVYYAEHQRLAQMEESDYYFGLAAALRGRRAGKLDVEELKDLIRETLNFTKYTVEFANSKEFTASPASINIRASFYHIIFAVIGCSVMFSGMISSKEFVGQDLLPFSNRIKTKHNSFKEEVDNLREEEKRQYKKLKELCRSPDSAVNFVAEMCCAKKESLTVYQDFEITTVKVEKLQNMKVMLLISELNLSNDDLTTLKSIYNEGKFKSSGYEIIWVPIADVKDDTQFQNKRSQMPWYSCISVVTKAAAKFIRKWWQFKQQTKVVVLNKMGEVENADAMSMIRLWGPKALPFTRKRGNELLKEISDNWLKLVVNNTVFQSIEQSWENKELIILYDSAEDSMVVGQIRNILSRSPYTSNFKFFNINTNRKQFLSRLENCISWMIQQVNKEMPDSLTLKLLELYTNYQKQSGFAIVARGSSVIVNTSLTDLLKVLSEHEKWFKEGSNTEDFETLFLDYFKKVIPMPQCYQFSIPNMVSDIPKSIKCPTDNCTRNMETVITFKCCHGEH